MSVHLVRQGCFSAQGDSDAPAGRACGRGFGWRSRGEASRLAPGWAAGVEAFEGVVAVALEAEELVGSSGVKFPVARETRKAARVEIQTHGYEVDLIGARADKLVLASVKSMLGSRGIVAEHVTGTGGDLALRKRDALLNDKELRGEVIRAAARRYPTWRCRRSPASRAAAGCFGRSAACPT